MFALKKFITPFLLPPGIFVLILVGYGFWCCRRRRYGAGLVTLLLGAFLWLSATVPVGSLLMRGLEGSLTIPRPLRGDVIILLGGGINGRRCIVRQRPCMSTWGCSGTGCPGSIAGIRCMVPAI